MPKPLPLVLLLVLCFHASGAVLLHSSFDSGTEGWSVGGLFHPDSEPDVEYVPDGGKQGGFLQTTDRFGTNAFRAPSSWLGNQSALFGATISFYQKAEHADPLTAPAVVLASGRTFLQYRAMPPKADWTGYSVALRAGEWQIGDGSGVEGLRFATDAELLRVLSDLEWMAFSADWQAGEDVNSLDEVSVFTMGSDDPDSGDPAATPEPASMTALAGIGALAVALWRS